MMSALPKKKLCWNCEGSVALQEEDCPYCGVYLNAVPSMGGISLPHQIEERVASFSKGEEEEEEAEGASEGSGAVLLPLLFLLCGSSLLLFGALLWLFSVDGMLTLRWNARWAPLYLAVAFPLFLFGWKALYQLEADEEPSG